MIHHGGSDKFYMSEEMIGAYLEGKLSPHDARYVESLMERDADIASLVDDCKAYSEIFHQYDYHDGISFTGTEDSVPDIDDSFSLPEIPDDAYNIVDIGLSPFTFDIIDPFEQCNESLDACSCHSVDVDIPTFGIDDIYPLNNLSSSNGILDQNLGLDLSDNDF